MNKVSEWLLHPRVLTIWGVFCSLLLVFVVYQGSADLANSKDLKAIQTRNDCRSQYNALLTEEKDKVVNLRADSQLILNSSLLHQQSTGERASAETVALYDSTNEALAKQRAFVATLPRLDQAVMNGFVLHATDYPPCPE